MAVSIDTVYQRVLALANKEQRGYITPQEFNLLANKAQLTIFESYFYAKNQRERTEDNRSRSIDETDLSELISRKLSPFMSVEVVIGGSTIPEQVVATDGTVIDVFHTGRIFYNTNVCKKVDISEVRGFHGSVRHANTLTMLGPIFTDSLTTMGDIQVFDGSSTAATTGVTIECFRIPVPVNWAYVVVNGTALYNANLAVDFELHRAEEDTLVNRILELAGVVINKPGLAQTAASKDAGEQTVQNV